MQYVRGLYGGRYERHSWFVVVDTMLQAFPFQTESTKELWWPQGPVWVGIKPPLLKFCMELHRLHESVEQSSLNPVSVNAGMKSGLGSSTSLKVFCVCLCSRSIVSRRLTRKGDEACNFDFSPMPRNKSTINKTVSKFKVQSYFRSDYRYSEDQFLLYGSVKHQKPCSLCLCQTTRYCSL